MSLLENFLTSEGTGVVQQLTKQFGLGGDQATSVLSAVVPMIAGGLKDKLAGDGATGLMNMITGNTFQQFATNPASLGSPAAVEQGKSMLSQIFGGSEAVSEVANKAAEKTGLGGSIISSMLPVVASLVIGHISKKAAGDSNSAMEMIGSFAGAEGIVGTLKGLAAKVFG